MNLDLRPPAAIRRTRNARAAIVLVVAFLASLLFANLVIAGVNNVIAEHAATTCGAC